MKTQDLTRRTLDQLKSRDRWRHNVVHVINQTYSHHDGDTKTENPLAYLHTALQDTDMSSFHKLLMSALGFSELESRYESIPPAFRSTYEWIFSPSSERHTWSNFVAWLQSDHPLYWITGKPGAGKSTLLKFICDDEQTAKYLRAWSGTSKLRILSFYFWNSGTEMQMSKEGLLRALLYQMLQPLPELARAVFPSRLETFVLFGEGEQFTWTELIRAFRLSLQKVTRTEKVVIFIDGLDELQGDHVGLISLVQSFVAPNVKICISSRPWVVFEDAFNTQPSLRLEDLTFNDMKIYVESNLSANPGFRVLRDLDHRQASELINNLTTKASGVFLWIYLVTRSLLEGLSGGERLSDLRRRLDSLPEDLENLFWKILKSLDSWHYERCSQLFQIKSASVLPLSVLDFSFADEDDVDFAVTMEQRTLTFQQMNARVELMRRRLNACTKGLLEVHRYWAETDVLSRGSTPDAANDTNDPPCTKPWAEVDYLHRTVRDFLLNKETWEKIALITKGTEFNVNQRLCQTCIARAKTQNPETVDGKFLWNTAVLGIEYAVRADPSCDTIQISHLRELDEALNTLAHTPQSSGNTYLTRHPYFSHTYWAQRRNGFEDCASLLHLAVRGQLVPYVRAALQELKAARANEEEYLSLLSVLLDLAKSSCGSFDQWKWSSLAHERPSDELIQLLCDHVAKKALYKLPKTTASNTPPVPHTVEKKARRPRFAKIFLRKRS